MASSSVAFSDREVRRSSNCDLDSDYWRSVSPVCVYIDSSRGDSDSRVLGEKETGSVGSGDTVKVATVETASNPSPVTTTGRSRVGFRLPSCSILASTSHAADSRDGNCCCSNGVTSPRGASSTEVRCSGSGGSVCLACRERRRHAPGNSLYMDRDLRYYFQHPYLRLIVAYLVIFCNFLLFAEDPVSHSHAESSIPVVGNVFSFVMTKYPPEWNWRLGKVLIWLFAILCGMLIGKNVIHHIVLRQWTRLKMFRDEQGSWMAMILTMIVSLYLFSHVYNFILLLGYVDYSSYHINSDMYITNASLMKAAACGTWLGDIITALMVSDMMLQDELYPNWAAGLRRYWRKRGSARIQVFWAGSALAVIVVITLIVSDLISWDQLNRGFVATTELSRAFLASFILVMDLLIVMQDWDFPHFSTTLNVNLPGLSVSTLQWKYAKLQFTGKWFNYGIIFVVLILDINMWKNQFFYVPENYGQYVDEQNRIHTVQDQLLLRTGNLSLWTYAARNMTNNATDQLYRLDDMVMNSKYMGYTMTTKWTAFIPTVIGFILFVTLVVVYGRFPPNKDGTYGGRLKKRRNSSWHHERRTRQHCDRETTHHCRNSNHRHHQHHRPHDHHQQQQDSSLQKPINGGGSSTPPGSTLFTTGNTSAMDSS